MNELARHGPGWWQASDGKWYPPAPNRVVSKPPLPPPVPAQVTGVPPLAATVPTAGHMASATVKVSSGFRAPSAAETTASTISNVLWLVLAGWWLAFFYVVAGLINCVTIIGIPFGIQSFKLAGYALWPFGRVVIHRPARDVGLSLIGNVVWFIFGGFWLALAHLFAALLGITIIGIPLALASLKMAGLAIAPFGKRVVSRRELAATPNVSVVVRFG